ncbi:type VI secretion system baseplate subunit TssK [Neisseria zalophi]|uniref:Type VI secretion system baseplate subunit TssK n=1 Tax=Neisseria zalophi TaxID=640030 RepID=A0A5J6PV91_9NEIS|nr:type VI secretion system baseplate subunit TssK [Neisseria zalophi]QEY26154.1 type VI secretion system baseplate subunit TssK [Neisseria zalophi]
MGIEAKVVWSEGIFITPQHFQQFERYLESSLRQFIMQNGYFWGFSSLTVDTSSLKAGVISVREAEGVFPDGSIFVFSEGQLPSLNLKVPANIKDEKVYLAVNLPSSVNSEVEFGKNEISSDVCRYKAFEKALSDTTNIDLDKRTITLAELNPVLILESNLTSGQTALPIAIIHSSSADFEVVLDESYIPPSLGSQKQQHLKSYISEIYGLLMQKSNSLANAVNDPNTGGSVEVMDFMMLQTINRYLAYLSHEKDGARKTHPEELFVNLSKLCADLMTFLPSRKVANIPVYEHNDLATCFGKLFFNLRKSLSMVLEQRAIRIPLDMRDEATHVAQTPDQSLLDKASFILAIKADMPSEALRQKIPSVVKIGTVEKVKELVAYHLPGIRVHALSVAPRELPYHNGYVYFELDKQHELWDAFDISSGMAFHLAGNFPNLDVEFWAIKSLS